MFTRQLAQAHCPPIVALQETNRTTAKYLRRTLPNVCGRRYEIVFGNDPAQDREIVLTTLKVLGSSGVRLAGPLRTALWVRLAASVGTVDLVTTHLASSSDDRPCDPSTCRSPCASTDTLGTCQAREAADLLDRKRGKRSVGVLAGDLNAHPDEPTIAVLRARGYIDTHDAAGLAECDPSTGAECTSGRIDDSLTDMKNAASQQSERIDYVFLAGRRSCSVVQPTGIFIPEGGPTVADGLVFPADHSGVEATLRCRTTAADRRAAKVATKHVETTTTVPSRPVSKSVSTSVTASFNTLFGGTQPDPEQRLLVLERGDEFHDSFIARMQSVGPIAAQTSVRIDSIDADGPNAVNVEFTILLNGSPVLDALRAERNQTRRPMARHRQDLLPDRHARDHRDPGSLPLTGPRRRQFSGRNSTSERSDSVYPYGAWSSFTACSIATVPTSRSPRSGWPSSATVSSPGRPSPRPNNSGCWISRPCSWTTRAGRPRTASR